MGVKLRESRGDRLVSVGRDKPQPNRHYVKGPNRRVWSGAGTSHSPIGITVKGLNRRVWSGAGTSHSPYYTARRDVPGADIRRGSIVGAVACPCPRSPISPFALVDSAYLDA